MVLLDTRTTSEDFGDIKLADCSFGMGDFSSTGDSRSLGPVVGLLR
jgi:hypothetical protein